MLAVLASICCADWISPWTVAATIGMSLVGLPAYVVWSRTWNARHGASFPSWGLPPAGLPNASQKIPPLLQQPLLGSVPGLGFTFHHVGCTALKYEACWTKSSKSGSVLASSPRP